MPYPLPNPVDLQFPVAGVDNSLPANRQPPLTTWDMLNCRGFPPSSDRLGGGSREGSSKLFEALAGVEGSRRVQGLDVLTESTAITDPGSFAIVPITEDWSGVAAANPTNLGGDWMPARMGPNAAVVGATASTLFSVDGSSRLLMDSGAYSGTGSRGEINMVLAAYFVDQATGVTCVINGSRTVATSSNGYGASDCPNNGGPCIAVDTTGRTGLVAMLVATAANTVQAKIYEFAPGNTMTERATSGNLTLVGDATVIDYTISITNTDGAIVATFTATGALTGPADMDEELTYTTALAGLRGGVMTNPRTTGTNLTDRVAFTSIALSQLHPAADTVVSTVNPALANPIDGNTYYLPTDWRGVSRASDGTLTLTAAGPTAVSAPDYPAVNDSANTLSVTLPDGGAATVDSVFRWALWTGDTGVQQGLSVTINTATYDDNEDIGSPVFRASPDGRNGLLLRLGTLRDATTGMMSQETGAGVAEVWAIVDNTPTFLQAINTGLSSSSSFFIWHQESNLRVTDDGSDVRFYVNGMLVYSFNPSSLANWTAGIGTALAAYTGIGFTGGSEPTGTGTSLASFGITRVVQGEQAPPLSFSNIKNKLAIYSAAAIEIGDTETLEISDVTGLVLRQPRPQSASFNRKFYAVDGERSVIVDPAALTSSDWAGQITDGVLPAECQLIEWFRGAPYLAATNDDPTIWYKGRTLDPLDFDYGADPQTSTAVAGNNGEVGQPADAITALVAFSDDYLVFGMARSIGVLEGDPNYGGQFQIVSREAGMVGPRSYCFDDRGNLYFVGASGLFRMLRGSFDPEPVNPRKLRRALEELDYSTHFIQLEFRASDRTVRIYSTPTDGETAASVFVYDTRTEAFYPDQLPLEHGPWAIEQINGVTDLDRNIIKGGNDGYIRRPDDDSLTDDGTAIASYVEIPVPDMGSGGLLEYIAQELQIVLAEGGGRITWRWFTARSPEQVRLQTVGDEVASGVISGTGFQEPIGLRATGAAHKLRLEATGLAEDGVTPNRWALERVTALLAPTSRRR